MYKPLRRNKRKVEKYAREHFIENLQEFIKTITKQIFCHECKRSNPRIVRKIPESLILYEFDPKQQKYIPKTAIIKEHNDWFLCAHCGNDIWEDEKDLKKLKLIDEQCTCAHGQICAEHGLTD